MRNQAEHVRGANADSSAAYGLDGFASESVAFGDRVPLEDRHGVESRKPNASASGPAPVPRLDLSAILVGTEEGSAPAPSDNRRGVSDDVSRNRRSSRDGGGTGSSDGMGAAAGYHTTEPRQYDSLRRLRSAHDAAWVGKSSADQASAPGSARGRGAGGKRLLHGLFVAPLIAERNGREQRERGAHATDNDRLSVRAVAHGPKAAL